MARRLVLLAGGAAIVGVAASGRAAPGDGAGDRFRPLRSASASATSFLQNDWNRYQENYHPSYVLDENPATAWVEGVDGYGEGQSLTLPLSPLSSARALRLRIWNGYQKSKDLFAKNSAPRKIRVTVLDPTGSEVTAKDADLQNAWGPQTVVVDVPAKRGLSAVRIAIVSVYPGTKYKDTCISDVLVDVDSDVPHNAAAENGKLAVLMAWVAKRKQMAAYFASKPPEYPFAFTQFAQTASTQVDRAEFDRLFAEGDALKAKLGTTRFKPAIKKPIRAVPDGLHLYLDAVFIHVHDFLQLFSLPAVALFETSEALSAHHKTDDDSGYEEDWTTSIRTVSAEGPGKRVRALAFGHKSAARERTISTSDDQYLLVYGDDGRLQRVYVDSQQQPDFDYQWIKVREIFSFSYDAAGKVTGAELLVYKTWLENEHKKEARDRRASRIVFAGQRDAAKQAP
jgi:hypothetical protein